MKTYLQYGFTALMVLAVVTGCRKDEFIPPPEGEKVAYEELNYQPVGDILKSSLPLFYKLIERSNMDSLLTGQHGFTLLAPTDAALQAAGITDAAIAAMTIARADTIVAFHTVRNIVTREELLQATGNRETATLLKNAGLTVTPYFYGNGTSNTSYDSYWYRQFLKGEGGKLLVNGLPAGDITKAVPAKNGYVYVIDKVLPGPVESSFWAVLEADPRFSMFIELQKKVDEVYDAEFRQTYINAAGWDPGGYGWVDAKRTNYRPTYDFVPDWSGMVSMRFSMMFAPTNDAFHAAGFQTVDDVLTMNEQPGTEPVFDFNTYDIMPFGYPSDSILAYHWDFGRDNLPYSGIYGKAPNQSGTVFFANDLRNEYIGDYVINHYTGSLEYKMPFTFGQKNGRPTVQVKGSGAEPATVIETINTLMGPLHVVDRLLIPKDLKMK
jgi:uncharacterized surface protein with fasciclin (FAS1) repeats